MSKISRGSRYPALDHADGGEFRKVESARMRERSVDHMGDRLIAHLDAAVAIANRLNPLDFRGRLCRNHF